MDDPRAKDRRLTGKQIAQFRAALQSAYSHATLSQMVRLELDENLESITTGANLDDIIFALILWAEQTGRLEDLVRAAAACNPRNDNIKQLVRDAEEWFQWNMEPAGFHIPQDIDRRTIFGYLHTMAGTFVKFDGKPYILHRNQTMIGRSPADCDLVIAQSFQFVGLAHAKILHHANGVYVEDCGSKNGTFVSGKRIAEMTHLAPGQRILLGGPQLRSGVCVLEYSLKPHNPTLTNPDS